MYEGTGFRYLDYSFYGVVKQPKHPFMSENWKREVLDAEAAAEALGFTFVQAHAPACAIRGEGMEAGLLGTVRSIEACGMLGIKEMVIHSGFFPEYTYPVDQQAYFEANAPFFRALIPAMEANNVHILFENTTRKHCGDGYFPVCGADLNAFVQFMDHPLFGAAWDVGHANMDGLDQHAEILTMGKNLRAIHVHDNDGTFDQHTAPFVGKTDYDAIMRGLIEAGFAGYFTLEADGFFKFGRTIDDAKPLAHPSKELKRASLKMLYEISRHILQTYDVFEE
jgi:sugar phosphate isomerase/epimerase